jgi:peptidoglycan/xylan/chitin deacetylase (PgdA/CDA1 family)/GT2 family glycosyltransferase
LESLIDQTGAEFDVVVVSDGEDDLTRVVSTQFHAPYPVRWIFHEKNRGLASARNSGAHAASGEILLFVDDDTPADPGLIETHIAHHTTPSTQFAVCGRIVEDPRPSVESAVDTFLRKSWILSLHTNQSAIGCQGPASVGPDFEKAVYFGLNCSIRRDQFLGMGGFNARLRFLDEEREFGHRLYRSGVLFHFEARAVVRHRNTKNMTEYFRYSWFYSAKADFQRVFKEGQRNPQTAVLGSIHQGSQAGKVIARSCWHGSEALLAISKGLEWTANRTGSRHLYGAWARIYRPAQYWAGLKSTGCTLEELKTAVGEPACALAFHSISKPVMAAETRFDIRPDRFRKFVQWTRLASYHWSSVSEWSAEARSREKLLLTFDDGYDNLYTELLPAVREFRLKPLVFLVANQIGGTNVWDQERGGRVRMLLSLDQIREMAAAGVEFGSHTLTHPWLPSVDDHRLLREVRDSKLRLEDLLGVEVPCFAYPFGAVDQRVRAAVVAAGYRLGFSTRAGLNWWNDPFCIHRAEIGQRDSLLDFVMKLRTGYSLRQWLSNQWASMENDVPSQFLRNAAKSIGDLTRRAAFARNP